MDLLDSITHRTQQQDTTVDNAAEADSTTEPSRLGLVTTDLSSSRKKREASSAIYAVPIELLLHVMRDNATQDMILKVM